MVPAATMLISTQHGVDRQPVALAPLVQRIRCLSLGGHPPTLRLREVDGPKAGPVLQRYVQIASATRQYFQADRNPVEIFIAEAGQHPVFELTPIGPDSRLFPQKDQAQSKRRRPVTDRWSLEVVFPGVRRPLAITGQA